MSAEKPRYNELEGLNNSHLIVHKVDY